MTMTNMKTIVTFWDMLCFARMLKKVGWDKFYRSIILAGYRTAAQDANFNYYEGLYDRHVVSLEKLKEVFKKRGF